MELNGNGKPSGSDLQADVQFTDGEGGVRSAENIVMWRVVLAGRLCHNDDPYGLGSKHLIERRKDHGERTSAV